MGPDCWRREGLHHEQVITTGFALSTEEVCQLIGGGARPGQVREIAHRYGSLDAYLDADPALLGNLGGITPRPLGLGEWEWVIGPADDEWPARLERAAAWPVLLYGRGDPSALGRLGMAVVGSRAMTRLGERTSELAAQASVHHGGSVVSGLALGVDSHAHASCLGADGVTVAVLGGDLEGGHEVPGGSRDRVTLAEAIVNGGGAIVSEQRPGTVPTAPTLVARNRLITALSAGVVICEAARGSGTCHAVRFALAQQRPILVPQPRAGHRAQRGAEVLVALADERGMSPEVLGLRGDERELVRGLYPVANGVAEDPETLDALIGLCLQLTRGGF